MLARGARLGVLAGGARLEVLARGARRCCLGCKNSSWKKKKRFLSNKTLVNFKTKGCEIGLSVPGWGWGYGVKNESGSAELQEVL